MAKQAGNLMTGDDASRPAYGNVRLFPASGRSTMLSPGEDRARTRATAHGCFVREMPRFSSATGMEKYGDHDSCMIKSKFFLFVMRRTGD
jgi:hypothetical protein